MEKIAVQCFTEEEWEAVKKDAAGADDICSGKNIIRNYGAISSQCIMLDNRFNPKESCIRDGYTIIIAAEYLGGKDVKEFEELKVPKILEIGCLERVHELIMNGSDFLSGDSCALSIIEDNYRKESVYCEDIKDCEDCLLCDNNVSKFKDYMKNPTKPKTTKENKDMSININSTVAKVFKDVDEAALVTKWVGSEYAEDNHRAFMDLNKNSKTVLTYVIDLEKEAEAKK